MEYMVWPFLFLCLNGCYGPPQTLRGQVERLPDSASVPAKNLPLLPLAAAPAARYSVDEQVRLAGEIADPAAWAERIFANGRPDLTPSRLIELHRRGVPPGHLDALYAREMRAREADSAMRAAERERSLVLRHDDELRQLRAMPPAYPGWGYPGYPYPGVYPGPVWMIRR